MRCGLLALFLILSICVAAADTEVQPFQRALLDTQARSARCSCKSVGACWYEGYEILEKTGKASIMTWDTCCELCAKTPGCRKMRLGGRSVGTHQTRTCRLYKAKAKRVPFTLPHPHTYLDCGVLDK